MTNDTTQEPPVDVTAEAPVVQIMRGSATPEEIAALTVLFAAMSGSVSGGEPNLLRGWSRPDRRLNRGVVLGGGWGRR